ncbi:MAG TPA: phosphomannomutase/phosphoglucomutase [Miltoncostaeaceae bacterium]|nr:phosphomannomutase/phosphoglucomutase [Miltoncostaeaceae bacterium]
MTIDPAVFKAYDVRGLHPEELDEEGARRVGAAFIDVTGARRVAVGHDTRLSSPGMADAFVEGALDAGADVAELGLCATEMLYFAVADGGYDAGACITASHNPPQYTGAKMVTAGALPLSGDTGIGEVGRIAMAGAPRSGPRGTRSRETDLLERFVEKCLSFVDVAAITGLTVVTDSANGMSGLYLPPVLERLDIEAVPYFLELDGRFPNHEPNPLLPENREFIMSKVREHGADLGIAFDGDADRCFFIDDAGEFVDGDFLTALLARHILGRSGPSTVVYDLRASRAVPDAITEAGGTPDMFRVGHAFIKRRMREVDAVFAGEVSGHYYFRDFSFADTGLVPALLVMEMVATSGRPLSELIAGFRAKYHISGEINSTVSDPEAVLQELRERFADGRQAEIDGLSVDYDDWHFNVRSSNTEPLVRLNLESLVSREDMERRRDEVLGVIRSG